MSFEVFGALLEPNTGKNSLVSVLRKVAVDRGCGPAPLPSGDHDPGQLELTPTSITCGSLPLTQGASPPQQKAVHSPVAIGPTPVQCYPHRPWSWDVSATWHCGTRPRASHP